MDTTIFLFEWKYVLSVWAWKLLGEKGKQHTEDMSVLKLLSARATCLHSANFPAEVVIKLTNMIRKPTFFHSTQKKKKKTDFSDGCSIRLKTQGTVLQRVGKTQRKANPFH